VIAAERGGWFGRGDAIEAGYSEAEIAQRVRAGRWVRLCRGAYAETDAGMRSMAPWDREAWIHARSAKAYFRRLGGRAVISHQSALVLHGLAISELDLRRVHLTNLSGPGRSGRRVCQHVAEPPISAVTSIGEVQVTSRARAVVETILSTSYPVAVSVVDAALREHLATAGELLEFVRHFGRQRGVRAAARAVAFGNGMSESVGESRTRVLLANLGLPEPTLQAVITDRSGKFVARVDFLLAAYGVVVEFDGTGKYVDRDALVAEKLREDRIRDLGYQVVRATWSDLSAPTALTARLHRAIDRAGPRLGGPTTTNPVRDD
jgi:predicted transcriptional regulator of viral defense system